MHLPQKGFTEKRPLCQEALQVVEDDDLIEFETMEEINNEEQLLQKDTSRVEGNSAVIKFERTKDNSKKEQPRSRETSQVEGDAPSMKVESTEEENVLSAARQDGSNPGSPKKRRKSRKRGPYNPYTVEQAKDAIRLAYIERVEATEIAKQLSFKYPTLMAFLRQHEKRTGIPRPRPHPTKRSNMKRSALSDADGSIAAFFNEQILPKMST